MGQLIKPPKCALGILRIFDMLYSAVINITVLLWKLVKWCKEKV